MDDMWVRAGIDTVEQRVVRKRNVNGSDANVDIDV